MRRIPVRLRRLVYTVVIHFGCGSIYRMNNVHLRTPKSSSHRPLFALFIYSNSLLFCFSRRLSEILLRSIDPTALFCSFHLCYAYRRKINDERDILEVTENTKTPTGDFKGFAADLRFFPPEHWCRHKSTWQAFVERHGREVLACASATQSFGSQGVNKRKQHQEAIRLRSPETVT